MPDIELSPVRGGSAELRGYLALPADDGPWPGVVVVHEAFGLNDVVRRQADHLATAGYAALALDLFSDGGAARCLVSTFRALMTGKGKAIADIEAGRDFLRNRPDATGRVGIIGFCMGGGFALVMASRGFDAAAPNYGPLPPKLERVLAGACPVVASYGGRDPLIPGAGRKLGRTLAAVGVEHDIKLYPGVGHSFLNDVPIGPGPLPTVMRVANVGPRPEAAADAWRRIETFFDTHLGD
ncbi:MAG: carboxymethylenebutenolidase [Pseudonocardiales bacterium]|nr:carboxymethylenebutenolidase [Pseudonocardiales bacterium]